jgi:hypothetical protein
MKLLTGIFLLALALPLFAQRKLNTGVPKYNPSAEAVFKGTVEDMVDRRCPVSGGMGSHILLRMEDDTQIEVHLATTEFTKLIEMNLHKGDRVKVTGFKTEFEGVPTIFARAVKRGIDEYVFRFQDGKPVW